MLLRKYIRMNWIYLWIYSLFKYENHAYCTTETFLQFIWCHSSSKFSLAQTLTGCSDLPVFWPDTWEAFLLRNVSLSAPAIKLMEPGVFTFCNTARSCFSPCALGGQVGTLLQAPARTWVSGTSPLGSTDLSLWHLGLPVRDQTWILFLINIRSIVEIYL